MIFIDCGAVFYGRFENVWFFTDGSTGTDTEFFGSQGQERLPAELVAAGDFAGFTLPMASMCVLGQQRCHR